MVLHFQDLLSLCTMMSQVLSSLLSVAFRCFSSLFVAFCSSLDSSRLLGVTKQIELTHQCFDKQVPCFGSCWGLQIIAQAAGAKVELNPRGREYGIGRKISLTSEGRAHAMFEGKKSTFDAFISHSDEVISYR